tara:strand:- start:588 stop:2267 length:1680 start_codon:yes stop_codon:yes gene_type:complete
MAGGLLNLIANGNQNVILNGNPSKTFFKTKYSKYTNFGLQKFRIDYEGLRTLRMNEESHFKFKINRYADLLMASYLVLTLPNIWSPIYPPKDEFSKWIGYDFKWIENIGTEIIKEITITVGGQVLQRFPGSYIRNVINRDYRNNNLFNEMTGNVKELNDPANALARVNAYPSTYYTSSQMGAEPSIHGRKLYIPLNPWFMNNSKVAFPLIALQYAELYINVTLRPVYELFQIRDVLDQTNLYPYVQPDFTRSDMLFYRFLQTPPSKELFDSDYEDKRTIWNADIHLISTYAFLSDQEQKVFAETVHKILFKDVHTYNFKNITGSKRLEIETSGLVSSWMFYFQRSDINLRNEWSNYTNWPYKWLPSNVEFPPVEDGYKYANYDISQNFFESFYANGFGPAIQPDNTASNIMITGDYKYENEQNIMKEMGIIFDGNYREKLMNREIFEYIEPYYSSNDTQIVPGLYHYNFSIDTDNNNYQPTGAINLNKFNKIELEFTTHSPTLDASAQVLTVCDASGNVIGVNKPIWNIYEYNYDLVIHEEKYNIITVENGNCGLMYAR